MADERDFELLDDYITNRLSEADRSSFEGRLHADPDLQHEYALQQRVVQGIKHARAAELKSMLNKVPVPSGNPGNSLVTKIILGTVASIMIAAAGYWYFNTEENDVIKPDTVTSIQERKPEKPAVEPEAQSEARPSQQRQQPAQQPAIVPKPKLQTEKNQTSAGTEQSKPSLAKKPDPLQAPDEPGQNAADGPALDAFDPATEENSANDNLETGDNGSTNPTLIVEADPNNRQYTFHYQFRNGKLLLFGPFEKNLYEVMEFSANKKRTIFLYYKNRYYRLENADGNVRPLEPITDPALLQKLEEYRASK